jgi:hypothetical protein
VEELLAGLLAHLLVAAFAALVQLLRERLDPGTPAII